MGFVYNLGVSVFVFLLRLASPFNERAALWVRGRRGWAGKIREKINPDDRVIWIHCASLGEFEQGRPLIEAVKKDFPFYRIILTFFSPSGYEIRKNYDGADGVSYLPADTPANAVKFINLVNPELVIFVKYEFWHNYISVLHQKGIPLYLISGIFRPGQHFFKWYGSFFRNMLWKFEKIYVQDQKSSELLKAIGIENVTVTGDTRFDRVQKIASSAKTIPVIEKFRGTERLFLAGSSWKQDEEIISEFINRSPMKMKWVFAPHEIDNDNIERLEKLLKVTVVRFSRFDESHAGDRVLIIDNIGMLSSAYRYAYIAAIGGGFGKGIHNILEPACWGIPVLFGPNNDKFKEAVDMKEKGAAREFRNFREFKPILDNWLDDNNSYKLSASGALDYVRENAGATSKIMTEIMQKDINSRRS